jgi:hypothetical protein
MPSWVIKAAIQGALSALPQPQRWNYVFQRHISRGLRLSDAYFEGKLAICRQHLTHHHAHQRRPPTRIVELGTGWLPIVPIGLALSGPHEILSVDINPLLRPQLIQETIAYFIHYADAGRLDEHLPHLDAQRVAMLRPSLEQLQQGDVLRALSLLHITPQIADASSIALADIDLIVSNSTLEHIPYDTIASIFRNFRMLLKPHGIMSHLIDLSDHYSQFDRTLTPYHFLRFPAAQWRYYNSSLHYQNRLRIADYRQLHSENGFHILHEDNRSAASALPDDLRLAPEFAHYSKDALLVTASWMVSRPNSAQT